MASNMRRALAAFSPDLEGRLSSPAKRTAFRSILFGLCFYHSLLLGRKKFGVGIGVGECARTGQGGAGQRPVWPDKQPQVAPAAAAGPLHTSCCVITGAPNAPTPPARRPAPLTPQALAAAWASAAPTPSTPATW